MVAGEANPAWPESTAPFGHQRQQGDCPSPLLQSAVNLFTGGKTDPERRPFAPLR
jgi:hypothetical protein